MLLPLFAIYPDLEPPLAGGCQSQGWRLSSQFGDRFRESGLDSSKPDTYLKLSVGVGGRWWW